MSNSQLSECLIFSIGGTTTHLYKADDLLLSLDTRIFSNFYDFLKLAAREIETFFEYKYFLFIWPGRGEFVEGNVIGSVNFSNEFPINVFDNMKRLFAENDKKCQNSQLFIMSDMQAIAWGVKNDYQHEIGENCLIVNFGTGVGLSIIQNGEVVREHGSIGACYGQIGRYLLIHKESGEMSFHPTETGEVPVYDNTKFVRLSEYIESHSEKSDFSNRIIKIIDFIKEVYLLDSKIDVFISGGNAVKISGHIHDFQKGGSKLHIIHHYKKLEVIGALTAWKSFTSLKADSYYHPNERLCFSF